MPQNLEGLSAANVSRFVRRARRELSAAVPFLLMVIVLCVTIRLHGQANESGAQDSSSKSKEPAVTDSQATDSNANADQQTQVSPRRGPIHIVPYGPPVKPPKTRPQASGALSNQGLVQYWGGPVISKVNVVEVLWGNFVDGPSTTGLDQFFTDITTSNYFGLLAEYSTVGLTGFGAGSPPGSNQTIGPGVFGGKFTISPSVCPGGAANPPCTINDTQIQNELVSQVNSLALPQPVQDPQGNFNTFYMIYFPPGVTIFLGRAGSCQQGGFCAYHSNTGNKLPYGVLPDFSPAGGCTAPHCGNGTSFQNLTAASSHELSEAVTDVDVGSATAFAPPLAWADQVSGEEIGDFCAHNNVQVTANGTIYTVQTEWSNMQNACVSAPAHFQLVPPAPASVIPGRPFNVTVTAQTSGNNFQIFGYNDTVHFTTSDPGPPAPTLPPDYTFVPQADNGAHTFSVTLQTLGNQTITASDTIVTAMVGTTTVNVAHNPDVTVASSHSSNFKQGDAADNYTLTVTNVGDTTTSGTVTVNDILPFGLTASAISGMGWTCSTPPTATCSRSDGLAALAAYPPITLTVSVANFAPPLVTNSVTVAGGGEVNTANDSASDPTVVIQMPDLGISKSHVGVFAQGQVNENYTLTISNFGFAPTNGTLVTVTDTLPMGLTATAISGTGWNCSAPPTLTCTRSDVLSNGSSYSPITLTVTVTQTGPPTNVTNTATVSGGGEINPANDTASDVTTITPPAPDLIVASTHSGSFTQGQIGARYSLTVSNIGPLATNGQVTLFDNPPFGALTPTAMSGSGWNCNPSGQPTCTRSDSLPAFTGGQPPSYPPVTLTVNVAPNAPTPVTNFAFVGGGGELNTANDSSADSTDIIQLPDLVPSQSHGTLVQGLTGVNYMLNVSNITAGTTSGTVTVTDTLPAALTATAMSGPGWNCTLGTLTCTRSDALGPFSSYPAITLTVSVANNAPSSVTNTVTVSGGGEIITSNDTSTDTAQVGPPVSFLVLSGGANVIAGSPANFFFLVNAPLPSVTNFSCSGLPVGTACTFNPSSVSGQFNAPVSLTITTSSGVASASPLPWYAAPPLYAILLPLLGVVGMGMRPRGGRKLLWLVAGLVGLAFVLFLAGCGGGSSGGPPPPPPRTPAGTYTITVTGNNSTANFQASTTVTLTVQ